MGMRIISIYLVIYFSDSMVIDDLNLVRLGLDPGEADAVLVVNTNTVLVCSYLRAFIFSHIV